LVIAPPSGAYRVSGSRPRLPTIITLLTDAMIIPPIDVCQDTPSAASTGTRMLEATRSHNATAANPNTKTARSPKCSASQPPIDPPTASPSAWVALRRAKSDASDRLARNSRGDIRPDDAGDVIDVAGIPRNFV